MRAREVSTLLADRAEEIVQKLLPGGKRAGNYWQAGDVQGNTGTSLYVHLVGDRRGHWRDAATGEHGDLLDLIAEQQGLSVPDAMKHALDMLGNPDRDLKPVQRIKAEKPVRDTRKAAKALWARSRPIMTSYAAHGQAYFDARGITLKNIHDLRFHHAAWLDVTGVDIPDHYPVMVKQDRRIAAIPAIIAAVRNACGDLQAVHRTFLDPVLAEKAGVDEPKRALGLLKGGACWLRRCGPCLILAEGIETALSVGMAFPGAALAAGITAHHLTEIELPGTFSRIMIAADNDEAGTRAADALTDRLKGRTVITVLPRAKDFNDDLLADGLMAMKQHVIRQIKHQQ